MGILKDFFTSRILLIDVSLHTLRMFVVRTVGESMEIDVCIERKYSDSIIQQARITIPGRIADEVRIIVQKYNIKDVRICVDDEDAAYYTYDDTIASNISEIRTAFQAENIPSVYAWHHSYMVGGTTYTTITTQSKTLTDAVYTVIKSAGVQKITLYPRTQAIAEAVERETGVCINVVYEENCVRVLSGIRGVVCFENIIPLGTNNIVSEVKKIFANTRPNNGDIDVLLCAYGTEEATRTEAHKVHAVIYSCIQPIGIAICEQQKQIYARYNQEEVPVTIMGTILSYAGIIDDISMHIKTPIIKLDMWQRIINTKEYVPPFTKGASHAYAPLVGLARQMLQGVRIKPFDL